MQKSIWIQRKYYLNPGLMPAQVTEMWGVGVVQVRRVEHQFHCGEGVLPVAAVTRCCPRLLLVSWLAGLGDSLKHGLSSRRGAGPLGDWQLCVLAVSGDRMVLTGRGAQSVDSASFSPAPSAKGDTDGCLFNCLQTSPPPPCLSLAGCIPNLEKLYPPFLVSLSLSFSLSHCPSLSLTLSLSFFPSVLLSIFLALSPSLSVSLRAGFVKVYSEAYSMWSIKCHCTTLFDMLMSTGHNNILSLSLSISNSKWHDKFRHFCVPKQRLHNKTIYNMDDE